MPGDVIDAEIISEEKIAEKPRPPSKFEAVSASAKSTANTVAQTLETFGANKTAEKVRVGLALGEAAGQTVDALKPAMESLKEFGKKLQDAGVIKMVPRRRAFSPRKRVT